jgi:hypothetical protein
MLWPSDDGGWLDFFGRLYIWATLSAVLATALALYASGGLKRYSERLSKSQAKQIADANERAAYADERAGEANKQAGIANASAGAANKVAGEATERAAKLELRASEAEERAKRSEAEIAKANAASDEAVAKVAEAETRSVQASAKAEAFRLDIAKANESAAQAHRAAEQERMARLRLEEILGGWRLSTEARVRLVDKLKPFSGTRFRLFVNPDESPFLNTFDSILASAGWTRENPSEPIVLSGKASIIYLSGLFVEVNSDFPPTVGLAIHALVQGLQDEGVTMKLNLVQPGQVESNVLRIVIGRRE